MKEKVAFLQKRTTKIFLKALAYTLLCLSLILIGFFSAKILWGGGF